MAIQETTFGPKQYLTLRKSILISQVSDHAMYDDAGKKLGAYLQNHNLKPSGPWTVLYFTWDQAAGKTDLGIAFPIDGLSEVDDPEFTITDIPETKATMDVHHGDYKNLGVTHRGLMEYTKEKQYEKSSEVMAVEEYIVDPMREQNPENYITNIYYLHN